MVKFSCVREDTEWTEGEEFPEQTSYWVHPDSLYLTGENTDSCKVCYVFQANHRSETHEFEYADRIYHEVDTIEEAAKFVIDFPYAVWDWCEGEPEQDFRTGIYQGYTLFVDHEHQEAVFQMADKMNTGEWGIEKANNDVRKGIQLLDERIPDWRGRVNPRYLDMHSGCQCVLGQIYGDYQEGCEILGIDGEDYGFDSGEDYSYRELDTAWKEALNA